MEKNRIVAEQAHENTIAKKEGRVPRQLDDELYERNSPGPGQTPAEENPETRKM